MEQPSPKTKAVPEFEVLIEANVLMKICPELKVIVVKSSEPQTIKSPPSMMMELRVLLPFTT